jgi:Reverse transcriptase (RNA-dependent DNA polymerase).
MMRKAVRKKRKRYQRARKHGDIVNVNECWNELKTKIREYKCAIREAKEHDWREFVRVKGNDEPWGEVYKICRDKRKCERLTNIRRNDGSIATTWIDSVNVLLNEFFPPAIAEMMNVRENEMNEDACFEWREIENAIRKVKVGKVPGLDGVNGEMIKRIWTAIPKHFKMVMDECLRMGYFPDVWKTASVVVLLKSRGRDRTDPRSYRPICLLPALGKVLERMLVGRLMKKLNGRMHDKQYGFRAGRSTEDAWNQVKMWVNESNVKYVLGVFVDFKGAFDNLCWVSVMNRLNEVHCDELNVWRSYFSNRRVCVVGANETVWWNVCKGCPQGSVCGPAIWNMMMDDLLWELNDRGCKVVAFADDLLLVIEGMSRSELETKGTEWMQCVIEWGRRVGVSVSESKTECMLLKGKLDRKPIVRMNENNLRYGMYVKYLGISVSERFNFGVHLQSVTDKIMGVIGAMRRVLKKEWGLGRKQCV